MGQLFEIMSQLVEIMGQTFRNEGHLFRIMGQQFGFCRASAVHFFGNCGASRVLTVVQHYMVLTQLFDKN
jgi:hypothetical protein